LLKKNFVAYYLKTSSLLHQKAYKNDDRRSYTLFGTEILFLYLIFCVFVILTGIMFTGRNLKNWRKKFFRLNATVFYILVIGAMTVAIKLSKEIFENKFSFSGHSAVHLLVSMLIVAVGIILIVNRVISSDFNKISFSQAFWLFFLNLAIFVFDPPLAFHTEYNTTFFVALIWASISFIVKSILNGKYRQINRANTGDQINRTVKVDKTRIKLAAIIKLPPFLLNLFTFLIDTGIIIGIFFAAIVSVLYFFKVILWVMRFSF